MFYVVESSKSFYEATLDLEPVVQRLGFVVLNSVNLGEILRGKDLEPDDDCMVFDVCNYRHLEKMLAIDIKLGTMLPWRISIFTDNGATKIALLRPEALLSGNPRLARLAAEMEEKLLQIVDETR